MRRREVTVERIMACISNTLNSNQAFSIDGFFSTEGQLTPSVTGGSLNDELHGELHKMLRKTKVVVSIGPQPGPLQRACLPGAIMVSK